jgi:excinuclease ABC subunit C
VKELLKHFGSVAQLRKATPEQIAEVRGVGPRLATAVFERLAEGTDTDRTDAERAEVRPEPGQAARASR